MDLWYSNKIYGYTSWSLPCLLQVKGLALAELIK